MADTTFQSAPMNTDQDNPPSYEEAQKSGEPPSYDSLFGELRRVKSPQGLASVLYRAVNTIANTVAAAVLLALFNIIPIVMIIVGALNRDRCPVNSSIPIWLIVSGSCTLARSASKFVFRSKDQERKPLLFGILELVLSIFLFIWFIIGSVWVYSAYNHVTYDSTSENFCDQVAYLISFIFITVSYALLALSCFCLCCCCCCVCLMKSDDDSPQSNPA